MRVRTTNNRLIGFAYKPGDAEQQELVAAGQSTEKAADHQYFQVTPEGVELPERVGSYALNLYGAQMCRVDEVRKAVEEPPVEESGTPPKTVDISGEDEPHTPMAGCGQCDAAFIAKTPAAAKGKLTRHTKKEHN